MIVIVFLVFVAGFAVGVAIASSTTKGAPR